MSKINERLKDIFELTDFGAQDVGEELMSLAREEIAEEIKSDALSKALDFIINYSDCDIVCETLSYIPEEDDICANNCENMNGECVLRFLKHYKKNAE
jgi:hypothetical protein